MKFEDNSIDLELTEQEGGAVECDDGDFGYTFFVSPIKLSTEIIITEKELKKMLKEIKEIK